MEIDNLLKTKKTEDEENHNREEIPYNENKNYFNLNNKYITSIFIFINYLLYYHRIIIICLIYFTFMRKENYSFLNVKSTKLNKAFIENNPFIKIPSNISYENEKISLEEENITFNKELKNINMTNILKTANNYIRACFNGKLINGIKKSSGKPKITTLTACYNSEKTIKAAIRSIQNQNMSDIEILIINDGSTDNSLKIIEQLQKEDPRIRIINNTENMGPLYAKSIGALEAKGKYIMHLDSDDLFINENLFNICYEEAEKNNIDILEFSGFRSIYKYLKISKKPKFPLYLMYKENNKTIIQPELSNFIYQKKDNEIKRLIDGYLWGKCIRSEILRKALHTIGANIYTQKMFYGDDRLVNFILFRVANSFKFIQEYGIVYYYTHNSIMNSNKQIRNCHDELINIMTIFYFTKNSTDSEIAAFEVKSRWEKLIRPGLGNRANIKYTIKLLNKIINCKFIKTKNRYMIYNLWKNRKKKKEKKEKLKKY